VAKQAGWRSHAFRRIEGERYVQFDAEFQVLTEGWNRVVGMPYLVYMPEKDRLLMAAYLDYRPCRPAVMFSDDRGETWSEPQLIASDARNPEFGENFGDTPLSLTYLGGGTVMFSGVEKRWVSTDFGRTWEARPIPAGRNGKPWAGWQWEPYLVDRDAKTGKVTRIAETAYSHEGDAYPAQGYYSQAYIRFSHDEGATWGEEIAVPQWQGVNEVGLVRAPAGHLVAYCRTDLPARFRDRAQRQPEGMEPPDLYSGFGISISEDDGLTWSPVRVLFDYGRHFVSFVVLPDGRMVMTYVVRVGYPFNADGFPTYGIEAMVSRDEGRTWDMDRRIILDEWTGNLRDKGAWWSSPQSTSSVLLPDGSILTVYGRAQGCLPTPEGQIGPPRDIGLLRWRCPQE